MWRMRILEPDGPNISVLLHMLGNVNNIQHEHCLGPGRDDPRHWQASITIKKDHLV